MQIIHMIRLIYNFSVIVTFKILRLQFSYQKYITNCLHMVLGDCSLYNELLRKSLALGIHYSIQNKLNFSWKLNYYTFCWNMKARLCLQYSMCCLQCRERAQLYVKNLPEKYGNIWDSSQWCKSYPITRVELHPVITGAVL